MPAKGYYLYHLDETTCGGRIVSGAADDTYNGRQRVRELDPVTCGKHEGLFHVCGGMGDRYSVKGVNRQWAGSIESLSSCPCQARFVPSMLTDTYDYNCNAGLAASREQDARKKKLIEAKAKGLEPMPLPARIYTTQHIMDDYDAKDMHHGDLSEEELKGRFGLTDVSAKVNPYTRTLAPSAPTNPYGGFYPGSLTESQPVVVSREESARLMFDELRELAKVFSFQGEYQNIITEMIGHMEGNSGRPYSSPQLDKALKEQILNDHSEKSTLLKIKDVISSYVDSEYSLYPLKYKDKFRETIGEYTVLPKFDRSIDRINGLVITVHDTWSTHITLESLEITGDSFRAKVHYRVQDHFGLDDDDILTFHQGRIFRIWFVLQRYVKYGYRPFITEMNATVEISGRQGE